MAKTHLTCSMSGCPRQALQYRTDGLCYDHGEQTDTLVEINKMQSDMRRDETPQTESLVTAINWLLDRARP